jgi:FkbM family methyltransferase
MGDAKEVCEGVVEDLIYDVGMHDGSDTALYLSRGFRVVAIEANPVLVDRAQSRFSSAQEAGRLTILGVGIGPSRGVFDFWVNEKNDEHSSFVEHVGCRNGSPCHPVKVRCQPLTDVFAKYGVPYYLKVDIERGDIHCLRALKSDDLPRYVSVEAHALEYLCILSVLGYNAFKCVDQMSHNYPRSRPNNESLRGRLTSAWLHYWRELERRGLRRRPSVGGHYFPTGSSGPFGEDTPGAWESLETVAYNWLHFKLGHKKRGTLNPRGWFDFHATILPAENHDGA